MADKTPTLDELIEYAKQLSPLDKVRLVEGVLPDVEASLQSAQGPSFESLYGCLAQFGPAPSAEDIEEVRREVLQDFPRSDIG